MQVFRCIDLFHLLRSTMLQNLRKSLEEPDEDIAEDLKIFDRATHTFGPQNINNHINFIVNCLTQLHEKL